MKDETLAQQLANTGNLLDLLNNQAWLRETQAIETDCGGRVEAGADLKSYTAQLDAVSPSASGRQRHQVKVLSILLPELNVWLQSWGLGLSFEAVYIEAQRRLYEHLQQPTVEQAAWLEALLAEDDQPLTSEQNVIRGQAIAMLSRMFTEDDWQAFAQTAAEGMAAGILQVRQHETFSSAAH